MRKQLLGILLKYGVGLGLLAWVVWSHWDRTTETGEEVGLAAALRKPVHAGPLALCVVICLTGVLLTFVRWYVLVRAQGLPFSLTAAFRLGLVGFFFNTFLPGAVGGDIVKATCIAREQSRRTVAVATVLLDRAVGLCGLFWLAAVLGGVFWATEALETLAGSAQATTVLEAILLGSWALAAASVIFWVVLGLLRPSAAEGLARRLEGVPKVGPALAEFWRAVWMYRCRGRSVGLALLLAMVGHVGFVLTFYFAARTLTPADRLPNLATHFLLVPVGMAIQAGFPTPGGVGGGEYGFGGLYQVLGFAFAFGVLGSLVQRVILWALGFLGYLVYLRLRPGLRHPTPEARPELAAAEV